MKQSIQRMCFACVKILKVKDQRVKVMVSNESSSQKEYTCEI
jgi:hypothetical protein